MWLVAFLVWVLAPTSTIIVSGQSNALALAPKLAPYYTVIGHQRGGMPIAYWAPEAEGWTLLRDAIEGRADAQAFVWCQGELDALLPERQPGDYQRALTDLIARVRALTRANLPVRICELGPLPIQKAVMNEIRAYVADDPLARVIPTNDLDWLPDQIHLTEYGYEVVAARVAQSLVIAKPVGLQMIP